MTKKVLVFLEEKLDLNDNDSDKLVIKGIVSNLEFSSTKVKNIRNTEKLIIIPFASFSKALSHSDFIGLESLVLIQDRNGYIRQANVIRLDRGDENLKDNSDDLISEIYQNEVKSWDGTVRFLSITNKFIYEIEYQKGKIYSTKYHSTKKKTGVGNKTNEDCIDWYLVTTFYWSDGSSSTYWTYLYTNCGNPCALARNAVSRDGYSVLKMYDCSNGGGGGSLNVLTVDTVENNLNKPCIDSALKKVTSSEVKNYITNLYTKTFVGFGSHLNLTIKDAPNLTVNGHTDFPYSTHTSDTWEISLNSDYLTNPNFNMSQEAWGQIIIHEILHSFIFQYSNEVFKDGYSHIVIFRDLVEPSKLLLMSAFGMSEADALRLSLNGMKDNWGYGDFESLCNQTYGVGQTDIQATFDDYTKGIKGTKCN